jgi:hypothetical protein
MGKKNKEKNANSGDKKLMIHFQGVEFIDPRIIANKARQPLWRQLKLRKLLLIALGNDVAKILFGVNKREFRLILH